MAVKDFQHVDRFQQILRGIQLEEIAAFFKKQGIIRTDIARTEGHDALVQVAERAFRFCGVIRVGIPQAVIRAFPQAGEADELLPVGQGRILNNG